MHKVGDTVWVFDQNNRIYKRDESGRAIGGPIFRYYFRPTLITGETSRSWVLSSGIKVPKAGGDVREYSKGAYGTGRVYMTQEGVDAEVFLHVHRHRISDAVQRCVDVAVLRQVAALVGYKVEE